MRLIDADELNEYIGRESLDTREKIFALVDRMPTLPNPCGKPCAFVRPHGEWEFVQRGKFVDMVCPFCKDVCVDGIAYNYSIDEVKETIESDTFGIHGKQDLPNFCPNCGADMRKEGESE